MRRARGRPGGAPGLTATCQPCQWSRDRRPRAATYSPKPLVGPGGLWRRPGAGGCSRTHAAPVAWRDARLRDVFDAVVPAMARWALAPAGAGAGDLLGPERDAVTGATPGRVGEFAAGRVAARAALAGLGDGPSRARRDGRRPRWPAGVVGSITHCAGLGRRRRRPARRPGGDRHRRRTGRAARCRGARRSSPRQPSATASVATSLGTIVFSAKEAFYKAWSSLDGAVLVGLRRRRRRAARRRDVRRAAPVPVRRRGRGGGRSAMASS